MRRTLVGPNQLHVADRCPGNEHGPGIGSGLVALLLDLEETRGWLEPHALLDDGADRAVQLDDLAPIDYWEIPQEDDGLFSHQAGEALVWGLGLGLAYAPPHEDGEQQGARSNGQLKSGFGHPDMRYGPALLDGIQDPCVLPAP